MPRQFCSSALGRDEKSRSWGVCLEPFRKRVESLCITGSQCVIGVPLCKVALLVRGDVSILYFNSNPLRCMFNKVCAPS